MIYNVHKWTCKFIMLVDMDINEKISGDKKSMLVLTTREYEVHLMNKYIIVMDEPYPEIYFD